jgi:hypothetical protein
MSASRLATAAFVWLCTAVAFGQIPVPPTPAPGTTGGANGTQGQTGPANGPRDNRQNTQTGNPNSDTNGAQDQSKDQMNPNGPDIVDDANATPEQKASAEYSGPAVLSRGISASEPLNPKNIKFTPSVGLEYLYTSGQTGVVVNSNGQIGSSVAQGVQMSYGIAGEKVLKSDTFSLIFSGDLYHYFNLSSLDGTDNQLKFTWRHRLSRHLSFGIQQSLQEYNRNYLLNSGAQVVNNGPGTTLVTANPVTEAFDGRVISLFTQGDLTYQMTNRLSINLSGGGFETRRASSSLFGNVGYQAGADAAYRITRRQTIGTYYSYSHYDYIGTYGGSDVHTVGLTYSIAFDPRTELITRIGGSRVETTGLSSVALDPFLALLLGTPSTVEAVYSVGYSPDLNIELRRKLNNLALSAAYARGITPGNGVILTSIRETGSIGFNYKARRVWNIAGNLGYDSLRGFGPTNQKFSSVYAGASVYRRVAKQLDWHFRFDFHHYTFDNTGFLRNNFVVSSGLVWTPGDLLNRLW